MKTLFFTSVFFVALSPIALTSTAQASNDRVALLLSGYDNAVSASDIARLSDDPAGDLIDIANDASVRWLARGRAVQLLGQYNEPRVLGALLTFSTHNAPLLRVRSLKALSFLAAHDATFAARSDVQEALSTRLSDGDVAVRLQAVRAMAAIPALHVQLAHHLLVEQEASVRNLTGELLAR
jgi:HEAT repeat protein